MFCAFLKTIQFASWLETFRGASREGDLLQRSPAEEAQSEEPFLFARSVLPS